MLWSEVRKTYPEQWVVVEALEAHTDIESRRQLDRLAVVDTCPDGTAAMQTYRGLHRQYPHREFYFLHTSRAEPDIIERQWLGIRRGNAPVSET